MIRLTEISRFARLLPLLFAVLLIACSSDKQGEPDDGMRDGELALELDVSILGSSDAGAGRLTRGALADDYEPAAYPWEDLSHLRVLIVDDATGLIVHNRGVLFENAVPVADDMRFKVKCENDYTIYLLGNCENTEAGLDFGIDVLPVDSEYPEGLIEDKVLICHDAPVLFDNTGISKTLIPMCEKFNVRTDKYTGALAQTQRVQMFITRAAAKFAFTIRASEDYVGDEGPALTSIFLTGLADKEYFLPRNAVYNPEKGDKSSNKYEGREIVSFSTPDDLTLSPYVFTLPEPLQISHGMTPYEWSPELYFAESPLTEEGFTCNLSFDNGEHWIVPVTLPNLPYGLPRNSFVTIDITVSNNNSLVVDLVVLPWNQYVSEFDYADEVNIASDGSLSFIAGSYKSLDKATGRMVLNDYPGVATGTFGIATPVGMRWDAYLITESGQQDAICFKLDDGSTTTRISGIVGAESKELFRIVPVNPPGTVPNVAILQVVVTTADGRGVPANILYGAGYGVDVRYLTIIQNPQ